MTKSYCDVCGKEIHDYPGSPRKRIIQFKAIFDMWPKPNFEITTEVCSECRNRLYNEYLYFLKYGGLIK